MAQSELLIHPSDSGSGVIHSVTPANAGWRYVGFELRKLMQGGRCVVETGDREVCAVLISGKARFTGDGFDSGIIGERRNAFEGLPWSLYLPSGCVASVEAETDCEVALCSAPAETLRAVLGHCSLPDAEAVVERHAPRIRAPDYYDSNFSSQDLAVIRQETAATASLWGY